MLLHATYTGSSIGRGRLSTGALVLSVLLVGLLRLFEFLLEVVGVFKPID